MAKAISGDVRQQLVGAIGERYQGGTRFEKARNLDEFVAREKGKVTAAR